MKRETIDVDGPRAPVEIAVDTWGIPHIRAENLDDLFFAQGFAIARDRLWQIDLWRKKGLGLLAADFGPGFLAQDYASRLFLYRGDMEREWAAYAPDAKAICTAFANGVNAYIDLIHREAERLPPEFLTMETFPARWRAADIVRIRSHAIGQNALSEILRSNVLDGADIATDLMRKALRPPVEPQAFDPTLGVTPLAAADLYRLATAHPTFSPERLAAKMPDAWDWTGVDENGEVVRRENAAPPTPIAEEGSNNWAISGARTASGRPILANDPHRVLRNPSLRTLVHLTAPGFDVIGANEPFLPGVSIGHNGKIAFGLTIFYVDQEDVFVYDTLRDGRSYRYGAGEEQIRRLTERFDIREASPLDLVLKFTRHGPIVHQSEGRAIAIRSVWFEPGAAPYARALTTMRAENFEAFRDGVRTWGTPSVNHVCADISGRIGWIAAGFTPVRPNWDGLLPAPGDGRCEWAGLLDNDKLPRIVDPDAGYVASANEMNLPPDFAHAVGYEWIDYARIDRVREALDAQDQHTIAQSCALQTDIHALPARDLIALLQPLTAEGDAGAALALLKGWNCRLEAGSAAAALYEVWWMRFLRPALLELFARNPQIRALLAPGDMSSLVYALQKPDDRFGDHPERMRDHLLEGALALAWRETQKLLGADPARWAWGALHKMHFDHALASIDPKFQPAAAPIPMGGDATSPMHTGYRIADFSIVTGSSVRLVIDVGQWDESRCVNAPGQSGDPRSPHYGDLSALWAKGEYAPLLFSRKAVDAATETLITLRPAT